MCTVSKKAEVDRKRETVTTIKKAGINSRDAGKKVGQGGPTGAKRSPTTLGQEIYPRNGGHPRHFLGNIMGYAS